MTVKLNSFLLLLLVSAFGYVKTLTFDSIMNKKKCTPDISDLSVECSAKLRSDMCAYFTGGNCESEYCAMFSINQCTACHNHTVEFYSNMSCTAEKVYCDLKARPKAKYVNLSDYDPVCAYYEKNCPYETCTIEVTNAVAACAMPDILYYKPGKCQVRTEVLCDAENRTQLRRSDLDVYQPVCAYHKDDCPTKFCGMEVINKNFACSMPQTVYYTPGKCDPDAEVFSCDYTYCNTDKDFSGYEPVCGLRSGCSGDHCTRTFNNKCLACSSSSFHWYKKGICAEDRQECDPNKRPKNCTNTTSEPVCAFFSNNINGLVFNTAENACNACLDSHVKYYTPGACNLTKNAPVYCFAGNRPQNCPETTEPVCAFFDMTSVSMTTERFTEMSSACSACKDNRVAYYEPGPCKVSCRSAEMRNARPTSFNYSYTKPVCGQYTLNQQTYSVSLQNKFVACDNFVLPIDSYKNGLCPGDEGIRCENNALGLTAGAILPVCGIFVEGCTNSSCRKTFAEPTVACEYSSAILYKAGVCPEDEGVSCDPYRPKAGEQLCLYTDLIYKKVCGYFTKGCRNRSCRMTFDTQCKACSVSTVIFFTEGPCPGDN